jgi:hypothetical protein
MKRSEFLKRIGLTTLLLPAIPLLAKERNQVIKVNKDLDIKIHKKDEEDVNISPSSGLIYDDEII